MLGRLVRGSWVRISLVTMLVFAFAWVSSRTAAAQDPSFGVSPRDVGTPPDSEVAGGQAVELQAPPADFQRIDQGAMVIEFPASVRARVEPLFDELYRARARLTSDLGQPVLSSVYVRIARNPQQMLALAPRGLPPYDFAAAMAYPSLHMIVMSLQAPSTWEATDMSELLQHELTHLALYEAVGGHHVPLWFNEGLAMYESGEGRWLRWPTVSFAAVADRLIPLSELNDALPRDANGVSLAYAESKDVVRFLARDADRARFASLVQRVRAGVPFDRALQDAYSTDVRKLEYEWREDVKKHLRLLPVLTSGGMFGFLTGALLMAAWVRRRNYAKAKLAEWAREEAESDAAAARTAKPALPTSEAVEAEPARVPSMPVVEHEGRWYTLH